MDVQLQELINKIKSEGVASAEKQAAAIADDAKRKAEAIVSDAEGKAKAIIDAAKQKEEQTVRSGKDALAHAGRDLILNLRSSIISLFDMILEEETGAALSGKALESAVAAIISSWSTEAAGKVDVLLPEKELAALEGSLKKKLAGKLAEGIEIKPAAGLSAGFRISVKDGSAYYDFTPAEIAAVLSQYLNPRLAQTLQQAAAE